MEVGGEQQHFLCTSCCKDIYLKKYVESNANITELCTICLQQSLCIEVTGNDKLINFCRLLVRYHFPEYDYNEHWGGDRLPKLFYTENPILSHDFANYSQREIDVEGFLYDLLDLGNSENPVDLYYGHDDEGGRGLFPEPIKNEKSGFWQTYKSFLKSKNAYLLEEEAIGKLSPFLNKAGHTIKMGAALNRARVGYVVIIEELGGMPVQKKIPLPGKELSAPPILKSKAGRANRQGVSFLYLASDKDTAIGEIRPHPGHYISVAEFTSKKDLWVVDLRFIDLFAFFQEKNGLAYFKVLKNLSDDLSIPILPEEQENYLVTQFLADIIRKVGFEGILFNSSISQGYNLIVFDPGSFEFTKGSEELVKVHNVSFNYRPVVYDADTFLLKWIEK